VVIWEHEISKKGTFSYLKKKELDKNGSYVTPKEETKWTEA